jgi:hypothetical protein
MEHFYLCLGSIEEKINAVDTDVDRPPLSHGWRIGGVH